MPNWWRVARRDSPRARHPRRPAVHARVPIRARQRAARGRSSGSACEPSTRPLGAHPGLFLTGSGFRGVGIPDCIADGRATAARVADVAHSTPHANEYDPLSPLLIAARGEASCSPAVLLSLCRPRPAHERARPAAGCRPSSCSRSRPPTRICSPCPKRTAASFASWSRRAARSARSRSAAPTATAPSGSASACGRPADA